LRHFPAIDKLAEERRASMELNLSLDKMTPEEKLRAIEVIWEDLCRTTPDLPSPEWHGDVLKQREKRASQGKEEFLDWDEAKDRIRKSIS
jgi:hypothetical protein